MNNTGELEVFQNINWYSAIPLGIAAIFFLALTFRRISGFYVSASQTDKRARSRNQLLSILDCGAFILSLMLALSPLEMWVIMAPCGLLMIVLLIPIWIMGEKSYLKSTIFWMNKIQNYAKLPPEYRVDMKPRYLATNVNLVWYEYAPIAFIIGCLVFSITVFMPAVFTSTTNRPPDFSNISLTIGIISGMVVGAVIMGWAYLKHRSPRKT